MPRICSICSHAERAEVDRAIVHGQPYRVIAGRFGLSKSAVERHAGEHVASLIARATTQRDRLNADALVAEIRVLREVTLGVLEESRESGEHKHALGAIARLEKQAELVARLLGELVERQRVETIDVLFADQWQRLRPRLVAALEPYPEASLALAEALSDAGE